MIQVAKHVGTFISGFSLDDPQELPNVMTLLRAYAETIAPWAERTAKQMIEEANQRDIAAWKATSSELSKEVNRTIMNTPIGDVFKDLMAEQVTLIKSIPLEAAARLHDLTIKGFEDSTRASEIQKEIMRSGQVAAGRAKTIARTEVARTSSLFTQARAESVGSQGYIWRTSDDSTVRPSHKKMNGKFVKWDEPPTLDGMTGNAGCLVNCRCWAEVVIPK